MLASIDAWKWVPDPFQYINAGVNADADAWCEQGLELTTVILYLLQLLAPISKIREN